MLKRIAFQVAMVAALLSPAAIAQAGYPDNISISGFSISRLGSTPLTDAQINAEIKPVARGNANGSGGIPSQLYAYYCQTTCSYNSCSTWCF